MAEVLITEFTDPGCPIAFSAEPFRRRLEWLFGAQIEWRTRMVVLSTTPQDYLDKGFTPDQQTAAFEDLVRDHGMPIDTRDRPRMHATAPGCRAVVAARLHAPALEDALLRRLRVRHFSGQLLDEPATLTDAAVDVGIDPAALVAWLEGEDVEAAYQEDWTASRTPTAAALAQADKLASWAGGLRYTCPSYEIVGGEMALSVPGFQPWDVYAVALANAAPGLARRSPPSSVEEVLRWAPFPLATREVAEVCGLDMRAAREALGRVGVENHAGADGFWSLTD